jgi:hypothetical protein
MHEWWESLFGTFSFLSAGLAAHLWFRASKIALPPHTEDSWDGKGPFMDAITLQSKKNAQAAFAAVFAAFFQSLAMAARVIGPLIHLP